jgi:predicted dehydrogenase
MMADAVKAGKDVYVEKPIAVTLEELIEANDIVKASDRIVQHGTQGRSSAGAAAAREFIQSGKIGKLLRVEESRSHYIPYWNNYACPQARRRPTGRRSCLTVPPVPSIPTSTDAGWVTAISRRERWAAG